ncbi:Protein of unknown function (DUF2599) [Pseudomonas sp. GM21]|uniref:DUF2599 domain-containing protein n=1 Tax=Pseudomonas sp. GM21 TaxID=1144325 RepID=UPI000272481A|nr:DUF2599 domain-containing protein [Pseudomonas sp. GM21]EJM15720.1 Protein of unknown function (DUF2599) [Pseudomonas sp. GM21]
MTDDQSASQWPWTLKFAGGESGSLITERQTLKSAMYAAMRSFFALACTLPMVFCTVAAQPLLDPLDTLKRINHNYNTLKDACQEPDTGAARGLYYCSGVTLRMVNDGPFNPWDYSPYAIKIGGTSYSWIRKDLSTRMLIHPAGFILRTPTDAAALSLPVKEQGWTCIYAFDGGTGPERKWYGCGFFDSREPPRAAQGVMNNRNSALAYGTCAEVGVSTDEQWTRNYTGPKAGSIQTGQCSWNAEKPSDWNAMIRTHESRLNPTSKDPYAFNGQVNEFMLKNASATNDGSENMKYIDAFIYDVNATRNFATRGDQAPPKQENGLNSARNFQKKLQAQGYSVPILRLDFTKPAEQRFSYIATDQAIDLTGASGAQPTPVAPAPSYIASADWIKRYDPGTRKDEWTLSVVPTATGRALPNKQAGALYDQLFTLKGADSNWRDNEHSAGSMRQQLSCVLANYRTKKPWNLEPFRPALSDGETRAAGCNPVPR